LQISLEKKILENAKELELPVLSARQLFQSTDASFKFDFTVADFC